MGFTKSNPPSKGCEDRHMRCHTECSEYIEWNKTRQEAEAKARKEYETNKVVVEYTQSEIAKNKRKHRR